jgi:hypothetical protein
MKHVPDDVSQQLDPPFAAAGQLFAHSLSIVHVDGQAVPPPDVLPPLPLEVPPPLDEPEELE